MNNFYKEVLEDMIADAEFDALTPEDDLDEAIDIMTARMEIATARTTASAAIASGIQSGEPIMTSASVVPLIFFRMFSSSSFMPYSASVLFATASAGSSSAMASRSVLPFSILSSIISL